MGNCISKRKNGGDGGEGIRFGRKKNEKNVGGSTKSVSTVNSSDAEGRVQQQQQQQQNGVGRKDTGLATLEVPLGAGRTTAQQKEADVVAAPPASPTKAKEERSRETATARTVAANGEAPAAPQFQEPAVSPPTQVGVKSAPERHVRAISRPPDLNIGNITSKPKVAAILPPASASPSSASPVSPMPKSKNALERVSTSDSIDSPTKGLSPPPAPTPPPSAPTPPPMPPTPPPRGGMATISEDKPLPSPTFPGRKTPPRGYTFAASSSPPLGKPSRSSSPERSISSGPNTPTVRISRSSSPPPFGRRSPGDEGFGYTPSSAPISRTSSPALGRRSSAPPGRYSPGDAMFGYLPKSAPISRTSSPVPTGENGKVSAPELTGRRSASPTVGQREPPPGARNDDTMPSPPPSPNGDARAEGPDTTTTSINGNVRETIER